MFENYGIDPVFNVKAMVHQTSVAAATLRAWERRYGIPSPPRTGSGYRLYSARDVAIIRWLKAQIESGMSISQAVSLLHSQLGQPSVNRTSIATSTDRLPASLQRLHDDIIAAAPKYDEDAIERAFNEAFSIFPVEDVCLNLIQPVLVTLGAMWHAGEMSISTEHYVTNLVRRRLISLLSVAPTATRTERILSACAPGEYHELGLLMLSVFLRRRGYGVVYLGQNTPATRMLDTINQIQPEVMLVSASRLRPASNLLSMLESFQNTLYTERAPIYAYGGRIFNHMPGLRDRMPGVFVGENAVDSANTLAQLMNNRGSSMFSQPTQARPEGRAALAALRQARSEIISRASARISADSFDFNTVAQKYERAQEASEHLYEILDAAVNFDQPAILTEAAYWEWDTFAPDGVQPEQLSICAMHLITSVRDSVPAQAHEVIEAYLAEMQTALRTS
jgi:MerR family transcriptional regulator, light-induced transcriptional regulator